MKIIQLFLDYNKRSLEKFYDVKIETDDTFEILLEIGKRKNFLRKEGKIVRRFTNDGKMDAILSNNEEEVSVSPIAQNATISLGLGVKPVKDVTIDLALVTNAYDFRLLITQASLKYHF